MRKKFNIFIILVTLIFINSCSGYEPIFTSKNLDFHIKDYSIVGEKQIGKQIYLKLLNLSRQKIKNNNARGIVISIKVEKNKNSINKDISGQILEYRINLNTEIIVTDYLTDKEILNDNFSSSFSYKVQDQYSETVKYENQSINHLIDKTYEDLIIKLSDKIKL
jgi:hypothetical protein